jgi:hypothetical protein
MPKLTAVIALGALLAAPLSFADIKQLQTLDQTRSFVDSVIVKTNTDEAAALNLVKEHAQATKEYSTLAIADLDAFSKNFVASASEREAVLGKPTGEVEFIEQKQAGKKMLRLTYLQHRARYPLLWNFDFYLTAGGWTLTAFNADNNATPLLDK